MSHRVSLELSGRTLTIETGKMAKQANGAVTVSYGDTVVLVASVSPSDVPEKKDYFPLMVDYREKTSAAGKFPGGYIKREGRPTEKEILTARLTDRPVRPLFPDGYYNEVQITASVLSADDENDPDVLAVIGASASLVVSDIPFLGPVGCVRVGLVDGQFVINPTHAQLETSQIELVVAGTAKAVTMVEGFAKEVNEETMIKAVLAGHEAIKQIAAIQEELRALAGQPKRDPVLFTVDKELYDRMETMLGSRLEKALVIKEKGKRQQEMKTMFDEAVAALKAEKPELEDFHLSLAFSEMERNLNRRLILDKNLRSDGRGPKDIRPIQCDVGILPRTHGSALFTRGETQALAITTLGSADDEQKMESLVGEMSKRFMLHYNFPPFSVGETGPMRGPGRREIGHGNLAERALSAVLPAEEAFPYTIRIVSDILESNGSSSMASVCGGTLSLMDAGVPVKGPVAGIAMGMVSEGDKFVILSDILGSEDATGAMDFKVAGTKDGITAFQLDIKTEGINEQIMRVALEQAREGRLHILAKMAQTLGAPRESLSVYAPRIISLQIPVDKIGTVIGPGGKMIKKSVEETGVEINIDDDGVVRIACTSKGNAQKAVEMIQRLTAEVEVGKLYKGIVKNIMEFGAFVEVLPGKEGLVHISKLAEGHVKKVEDVTKIGDEMMVKVTEIDERGRINLSRRAAMEDMGLIPKRESAPHSERPERPERHKNKTP